MNSSQSCLYTGDDADLISLSPHLFQAGAEAGFREWYMRNGWGNAWGILVGSGFSFQECFRHFRKFLLVRTEEDKELYFRFYDPRVLKIFLPTCDRKQILEFFGPIEHFIVEGEVKNEAVLFQHQNGILQQMTVPAEKALGREIAKQP